MLLSIHKYDISIGSARWPWSHMKLHRRPEYGAIHFVWGKFSLHIQDGTLEHIPLCAMCDSSEIGEVFSGDEGLTVCQDCGAVEQGYKYISERQLNAR